MSTNGLMVTVVGWAASTPREVTGDGVPYTSFRLATTPRRYDTRQGAWTDGRTEWITVKAFRDVAFNVAASVRKGDPLVVHGRLRTQEWVSETGPRTDLVLDAGALGHDLSRGRGSFARSVHVGQAAGGGGEVDTTEVDDAVDPWSTDGVGASEPAGDGGGPAPAVTRTPGDRIGLSAVKDREVKDRPAKDRAVKDRAAEDGAVEDGAAEDRAVEDGVAQGSGVEDTGEAEAS